MSALPKVKSSAQPRAATFEAGGKAADQMQIARTWVWALQSDICIRNVGGSIWRSPILEFWKKHHESFPHHVPRSFGKTETPLITQVHRECDITLHFMHSNEVVIAVCSCHRRLNDASKWLLPSRGRINVENITYLTQTEVLYWIVLPRCWKQTERYYYPYDNSRTYPIL